MKASSLISCVLLFALFSFLSSCNKYLDVSKSNSIPIRQGFFEFYHDSNLLIYKTNVILTRDTEKIYPKSFKIKVPKKLKYYEFKSSSDFALYYDKGQVIFIKIDLDSKNAMNDTTYIPTREQLNEFIQFKTSIGDGKYDIKKIPLYQESKSAIIQKGDAVILLYNIHAENYNQFFEYVNEFKFIN